MSSMMLSVNGRVGGNPVLREGGSGTKWVRFSLACSSNYRNQDGKWIQSETTWLNCKAWGTLAVNIAKSLHKGDPVLVQGRLVVGTYQHTDKETGEVSDRADLSLHLTHVGIDLVHAATLNVKHANEDEQAAISSTSPFDIDPDNSAAQVPDELVEEIDGVEESTLVETASGAVPF